MRKGFNPNKNKIINKSDYFHQIIIPVYIPNNEGYFKESLQILKICLASLFKTIHKQTFVTVVNNGSSEEVIELLEIHFQNNQIHELIHTTNIGKFNAIIKGVSGHDFDLVTVSDADVLFLNNWQKATYEVFDTFKKTGFVSPVPNSRMLRYNTANVILENLFSKKLAFTKVKDPEAMKMFAKSIGNNELYNKDNLEKYLTLSKDNKRAIVGGGHFVGTYQGDVLRNFKTLFTDFALGGKSINTLLDKPVFDEGFWRLSTEFNYAYHLGNVEEEWMYEVLEKVKDETSDFSINLNQKKETKIWNLISNKIVNNKLFWKLFFSFKKQKNYMKNNYRKS